MKAITVWQPWASLLATGKKHIETRAWRTNYRGEILIHAAKKPYSQVELMIPREDRKLIENALRLKYIDWKERVPTSVIVGKANLVNCVLIDETTSELIKEQHPDEYAFGDFTPGRYAWVMESPVLFKEPIPTKGKQGLWNWEGEVPNE